VGVKTLVATGSFIAPEPPAIEPSFKAFGYWDFQNQMYITGLLPFIIRCEVYFK
jgi:hypothetical protein